MAYAPTDITYITLSSADDPRVTSGVGTFQDEFLNIFPQTAHFGAPGRRLKVALSSVTYTLAQGQPTYPIAFINTNAVVSNIVVGSSFTNNIGRILLNQNGTQQYVADTLHWFDASQMDFAQMDASITFDRPITPGGNDYNVPMDSSSVTYITLALKLE